MTFDEIRNKIQSKLDRGTSLRARVLFDFGDDGALFIDTTSDPVTLIPERKDDADVTLSTSLDTFAAILNGTQDPNLAFMFGKLKIAGSMGLALKLNSFLED